MKLINTNKGLRIVEYCCGEAKENGKWFCVWTDVTGVKSAHPTRHIACKQPYDNARTTLRFCPFCGRNVLVLTKEDSLNNIKSRLLRELETLIDRL